MITRLAQPPQSPPNPYPLLSAACSLAERGFSIFPLMPRGKHPLTTHGLKDATNDVEQVWAWWSDAPTANIGLPTGVINSVVVLDEDGPEGAAALARLVAEHGALPRTLTTTTARGKHYHFAHPSADVRNSAGKLGVKLDVRGDGGYVIVTPSVHSTGAVYRWETPILDTAPLPPWLHRLMAATPKPTPASVIMPGGDSHAAVLRRARIYVAAAEGQGEGSRNGACFRLAGSLAAFIGANGDGLKEEEILDLLHDFNRRCQPPLSAQELGKAVASAMKNGTAREPKPAPKTRQKRKTFRSEHAMEVALHGN